MPVWAIATPAATASSRFFGLTPESAPAPAPYGVNVSRAAIHLGGAGVSPACGRPRNWRTASSTSPRPRTSLSALTQVGGRRVVLRVEAAGDRQHHGADHREAHDPAEHEGRAVDAPARRHEHQYDRHDRERAERHADRDREHLADGFAHEEH